MKSTAWDQQQLPQPAGFAGAIRTIAERITEPVIRIAAIQGAFIPGVGTALDKLKEAFGVNLAVSIPSFPLSLSPLDGTPPPLTARDGKRPVFIDGMKVSFTISHNRKGNEQLVLEHVDICLLDVQKGIDPFFEFQANVNAIIGAGMLNKEVLSSGPVVCSSTHQHPGMRRLRRMPVRCLIITCLIP
ncbi:hypothetical protein [Chitinophaga pinensis]|uniref:Uncharacterized protein n=1 Tax=Chitinophaga pinensis (strain ATCC 43595 / DSM 2588 / LMG 13176 / NBRC 15968 / NCIMB 11800 / UQM 2034) TaxID=485918 RepID=A0A979GXL0_CHIPD|nr:hypothetical protein [Chitinophaga pinensis]ACU61250.1 hypothetical protein Cpin_3788 [Chitinophaga pinensis DSM 2588]